MVNLAYVFASVIVAGVFAFAAAAKLANLQSTEEATRAFGLPDVLARPLAVVLPILEGIVAVLLLLPATAVWGAVGALALLGVFLFAIWVNLARGRRPVCNCFGQVHATPIGWQTVTRNLALAAMAVGVLARARLGSPPSVVRELARLVEGHWLATSVVLFVIVVFALQSWIILHLLRQRGSSLLRIDAIEDADRRTVPQPKKDQRPAGPAVGTPVPMFSLPGLSGDDVAIASLLRLGRPALIVFSEPGCQPCKQLLPKLVSWTKQHAEHVSIVVISTAATDEYKARLAKSGLTTALFQRKRELSEHFGVSGSPSAVLIHTDGTVGSSLAQGAVAITALVSRIVQGTSGEGSVVPAVARGGVPTSPSGRSMATAVPTFRLSDLEGTQVDTRVFRDRSQLFVFWNPDCGYCARLLPELREWDRERSDDAPTLVVISTGSAQRNRELQLRAPVLLDQNFAMGSALGIRGTPAALFVGVDGAVLAPVAVGAPQIVALVSATIGERPARANSMAMAR